MLQRPSLFSTLVDTIHNKASKSHDNSLEDDYNIEQPSENFGGRRLSGVLSRFGSGAQLRRRDSKADHENPPTSLQVEQFKAFYLTIVNKRCIQISFPWNSWDYI